MSTTTKPVSKTKAEKVFKAFKKKYEHWDTSDASLVLDWHDGHPAICWESGNAPEDWAVEWDDDIAGTFCEAYYSFVLVIYPAWN
jgi:hypothetical protein